MNVEIGTEAAQFQEKDPINGIYRCSVCCLNGFLQGTFFRAHATVPLIKRAPTCEEWALLHEVPDVDGGVAEELVLAGVVLVIHVDLHHVAVHLLQRELIPKRQ